MADITVIDARDDLCVLLLLLPITPAQDAQGTPIVATDSASCPKFPNGTDATTQAERDRLDAGTLKWERTQYRVLSKQEYGPMTATRKEDGSFGDPKDGFATREELPRTRLTQEEGDAEKRRIYAGRLAAVQGEYDAAVPVASNEIGATLTAV